MNTNQFLTLLRKAHPGRVSVTTREAIQSTGVAQTTLHRHLTEGALPGIEVARGEKGRVTRLIDLTVQDQKGDASRA